MSAVLYWFAAAAFFSVGAVALARPDLILDIRAHFRPLENPDPMTNRRRGTFGPRAVRICGVVLLIIGAALVRSLAIGAA